MNNNTKSARIRAARNFARGEGTTIISRRQTQPGLKHNEANTTYEIHVGHRPRVHRKPKVGNKTGHHKPIE